MHLHKGAQRRGVGGSLALTGTAPQPQSGKHLSLGLERLEGGLPLLRPEI